MPDDLNWFENVNVQLRDGYSVRDGRGREVSTVYGAQVAFYGGFAHIVVAGAEQVQAVPAAAVWRSIYPVG